MRKHHFEGIAAVLASMRPTDGTDRTLWRAIVDRVADWCEGQTRDKADGRRFDRAKWMGQCHSARGVCKHCGAIGMVGEECNHCEPLDGLGPMIYQPMTELVQCEGGMSK